MLAVFSHSLLHHLETGSLPNGRLSFLLGRLASNLLGSVCVCPPIHRWGQMHASILQVGVVHSSPGPHAHVVNAFLPRPSPQLLLQDFKARLASW